MRGIFVKNYIDQSQEFALCAVALVYPIIRLLRANKMLAGVGAGRDLARLHRQHGVRRRLADGDRYDADHAGGVCAASPETAHQPDHHWRDGRPGRACFGFTTTDLRWGPKRILRDYQLYKTEQLRDIGRASARVLAEIPAVLFRGAGHRPRDGLAARALRAGRDRLFRSAPTARLSAIRTTRR